MTQPLTARRTALSVAIALSLASMPGFAQESTDGSDEEVSSPTTLEAIEVTADGERRSTENSDSYTTEVMRTATPLSMSIRETPQSVSVVSRQQIEDRNLEDVTDVVKTVTGLHSRQYDTSRARFNARGFEIGNLMVDGVPTSWRPGWSAGETQRSMVMYDHVEVVRGATGLTTGFGNPAAAINLVRKHADSRELTGDISVSGGRWSTYSATADVTTPLNSSGSVRGRIVANYKQADSYQDLLEDEQSVFYGVVDADLTDATTLSLGVSYQDNDPTGSTWGGLPPWYDDGSRTDWDRDKTTAADWTYWASEDTGYFATLNHRFANGWSVEARYDRAETDGDMKLLYLSGQPDRVTGLGMGRSTSYYLTERVQDTITLSTSGPFQLAGREHELAFGYIHSDMDFESIGHASANTPPGNFNTWDGSYPEPVWGATSIADARDTTEDSFYAVTRLSLADNLTAVLGGRLASYEIDGQTWQGPFGYEHNDVFTPYGGLILDLNEEVSAYASYTDIFNPQDSFDIDGEALDPISGQTYEMGLKGEFYEGRLNASLALFRIEQDNVATQAGTQPDGNGGTVAYYRGQEGVESDGYEIDVAGQVAPGWEVSAGLSVFSARDQDGDEANTEFPRRSLKLFTRYQFQNSLRPLTVGGGVTWFSEGYKEVSNPVNSEDERLEQGAYSLVSLMARYQFTPELSAQVNVDNLLDKKYYSQVGFYDQYSYGEPRNVTATLKYSF